MASAGLDLLRIQLFGRWGSQAFLLYVRGAPLVRMHGLAREAQAGLQVLDLQSQLAELHVQALKLRQQGLQHQGAQPPSGRPWQVQEPAAILDGETAAQLFPATGERTVFIMNNMIGGRVHTAADDHRTHCGWVDTQGQACKVTSIQGKPLCPICFELDQAGAPAQSSDSD